MWRGILFLVDFHCGGSTGSFVGNQTSETHFRPQNTFHVVCLAHNLLLIFAIIIFYKSVELFILSKDLHLSKFHATTLRHLGSCPNNTHYDLSQVFKFCYILQLSALSQLSRSFSFQTALRSTNFNVTKKKMKHLRRNGSLVTKLQILEEYPN